MTMQPAELTEAEGSDVAIAKELAFYLRAAFEWIDAIPANVASQLPAMPGFDRDAAESLLDTANKRYAAARKG